MTAERAPRDPCRDIAPRVSSADTINNSTPVKAGRDLNIIMRAADMPVLTTAPVAWR